MNMDLPFKLGKVNLAYLHLTPSAISLQVDFGPINVGSILSITGQRGMLCLHLNGDAFVGYPDTKKGVSIGFGMNFAKISDSYFKLNGAVTLLGVTASAAIDISATKFDEIGRAHV